MIKKLSFTEKKKYNNNINIKDNMPNMKMILIKSIIIKFILKNKKNLILSIENKNVL